MNCVYQKLERLVIVTALLLACAGTAFADPPNGKAIEDEKAREKQLAEDRVKELPMKIVDGVMGIIAFAWGVFCLVYLWIRIRLDATALTEHATGKRFDLAAIMVLTWVLGPPTYLALESLVFHFEHDWHPRPERLDALKHGQELARNFWIAMGALVITLYTRGAEWLKAG